VLSDRSPGARVARAVSLAAQHARVDEVTAHRGDIVDDVREPVVDLALAQGLAVCQQPLGDVRVDLVAVGDAGGVGRKAAVDEEAVDTRRARWGRCGGEGRAEDVALDAR